MTSNAALKPNVEDLEAQDRAYMFHPSTHLKNHAHGKAPCRIMADGEGVYVTDRDGRQSLDAFAGLYCVNVGYGRKEIADAVYRQMQELAYYHAYVGHSSEPAIELSRRDHREGAGRHAPGLLRPVRLGCQRDPDQAGLVLQQRPRPAREEEDHLARARLSRLRPDDRQPHGPAGCSTRRSTCRCRRSATRCARTTGSMPRRARASWTSPGAAPPSWSS